MLRLGVHCIATWLWGTHEVVALDSEEYKHHVSSPTLGRNLLMAIQMLPWSVAEFCVDLKVICMEEYRTTPKPVL